MERHIRLQISLLVRTEQRPSVPSVDHLRKLRPGWTSGTTAPLWCCSNPGQALPGFEPRRASRLAQAGSVAWFLSHGPLKAKPSHPTWRQGSWGAAPPQPSLAGHPHRGLSSPWGLRPAWCLAHGPGSRLDPSWGSWDKAGLWGPGARVPDSHLPLQMASSRSRSAASHEGWEVWWMEAGSLFSQAPTGGVGRGCLQGLSLWRLDEESRTNCSSSCRVSAYIFVWRLQKLPQTGCF